MYVPQYNRDFGWALTQLRMGARVCRATWNGRFIVLQKGYPDGIPINANTAEATGMPQGTVCKFQPYIMHKDRDESFVPWTSTTQDILGCDWDYAPGYVKGDAA